ncbi:skin secretory protein xP2 [Nomascus leucogenys]|uniref:skin secretory protein xP2 n=1 Tax=Nomascus leucogenys TaxID=61853 RepID=UPI00062AC0BA|nr:skin secretory protein xP2 [Nomascus leucogenys]
MAVVAPAAGLGAEILGPRRRSCPASGAAPAGAARPPRSGMRGSPWRAAGASFPAPAQLLLPAPPPGSRAHPGSAPGGAPSPALAARPAPPAPPVLIQLCGGDAHPPLAFSRARSSGALPEHPGATCVRTSSQSPQPRCRPGRRRIPAEVPRLTQPLSAHSALPWARCRLTYSCVVQALQKGKAPRLHWEGPWS